MALRRRRSFLARSGSLLIPPKSEKLVDLFPLYLVERQVAAATWSAATWTASDGRLTGPSAVSTHDGPDVIIQHRQTDHNPHMQYGQTA
jgi:hypothetical protein